MPRCTSFGQSRAAKRCADRSAARQAHDTFFGKICAPGSWETSRGADLFQTAMMFRGHRAVRFAVRAASPDGALCRGAVTICPHRRAARRRRPCFANGVVWVRLFGAEYSEEVFRKRGILRTGEDVRPHRKEQMYLRGVRRRKWAVRSACGRDGLFPCGRPTGRRRRR